MQHSLLQLFLIFMKNLLFMITALINPITDGGPVFMIPLVLFMGVILLLLLLTLGGKRDGSKMSKLISHISLFALVWGILGSTLGLITAFDAMEAIDNVATPIVAGGLKVALLSTLFGCIAFLVGRAAMFIIALRADNTSSN